MKSLSNGGSTNYKNSSALLMLPDLNVLFNINSIAIFLSMSLVTTKYRVKMDSSIEDAIMVHISKN